MAKITGGMRERLDGIVGFLRGYGAAADLEDPSEPHGCSPRLMLGAVIALAVIIALYATGRIVYDFTLTPAERAAADAAASSAGDGADADAGIDPQLPGEPYLDGRHYAIFGIGDGGENRVYTFELIGDGDSGAIRVWEDDTGQGTFEIVNGAIRIEMWRMVPPDRHEILEPNVFEGAMSPDGSGFSGTWTREGWSGLPGEVELEGEFESVAFSGRRL
ncbi:MAG: hypothetical protein JXA36_03485 [Coriobacteriia bacterium]|nr:hypothetical protein [Coriobacteriia bacterium]